MDKYIRKIYLQADKLRKSQTFEFNLPIHQKL